MYKVINLFPFEKRSNYLLNKTKDVSFIIKTLERKDQLCNQLHSLRQLKCKCPILIADDSKHPYEKEVLDLFNDLDITYFSLPYDTGTSEGRNIMLSHVKTPFFVLCDDDFIFDARSRIPLMRRMLIENSLDILGGVFLEYWAMNSFDYWRYKYSLKLVKNNILIPPKHKYEYFGNFNLEGETCRMSKVEYRDPFTVCDITQNFFLARTDAVKKFGGWNPILKGGEHQNFFIRAKLNHLKVATSRKYGVVHDRNVTPCSEEYKKLRGRDASFQRLALQEFGLTKMENFENVLGGKFGE